VTGHNTAMSTTVKKVVCNLHEGEEKRQNRQDKCSATNCHTAASFEKRSKSTNVFKDSEAMARLIQFHASRNGKADIRVSNKRGKAKRSR
jgi:hypothetical protein